MALRTKKTFIFFALELVYGTAVALVPADAIRTHGAKITPLEGTTVKRDLDGQTFGNDGELHVGTHVSVEFDVELSGSGTAGTAPKFGKLLKACQCGETIVATTSVAYAPASNSTDSGTMYFQLDGQRHALRGCRGTFQVKLDSQGIPYLHFMFKGLWVAPASIADIVPDLSAGWTVPRPVTFANTPTITLHGLTAPYKSFSYDHKNQVEHFDNPGEEMVEITDRSPDGQVSLVAPAISVKDYFSTARADTMAAMTVVHGTTAGNIVTFAATKVQLLQPKYGEDKGRAMLDANLSFVRTVGDDEMSLTFT